MARYLLLALIAYSWIWATCGVGSLTLGRRFEGVVGDRILYEKVLSLQYLTC